MFFGEYLIYRGKITREELDFALRFQNDENIMNTISAITNGYLTYEGISKIMDFIRMTGLKFNEAASRLRLLNMEQLEKISSDKERVRHRIGEILVICGVISKADMEEELQNFLVHFHSEKLHTSEFDFIRACP